jgi:PmbA protein
MPITKDLAKSILQKVRSKADEAEVYASSSKQLKIDVINRKLESIDNITEGGLALRVIKNKRMGFAYTADMDEHSLEILIEQALANSESSQPDENIGFPEPKTQTRSITLVEGDIRNARLEDKIKLAVEIEKAAYSFDKRIRKSEKISYMDSISTTVIANSKGVNVQYEKAVCGASAEVIAEDGGLMETGSWLKFSTAFKDLDARYIGEEAAKRAALMLGAKQEKSGRAPILLSPYAGSILISAIAPALSAENVQRGKSIFTNAIDKRIASHKFNLIDCGILKGGTSSVPYDDEGVPTRETSIIENGILKTFLHNAYTAKKSKASPTANSFRSSFNSQPEINPTNLYVCPGSKTQEEILSGMSIGMLVTSIMGAHTINTISGDFSIGFSGFLIENGKISRPVRGMTIAGNIFDILNHTDEIGSDLMFFPHGGSIGAPSILVFGLSVSGI